MKNFLFMLLISLAFPCLSFTAQQSTNGNQSMEQEEVSPNEDLMREHGILNRLLLVYQEISRRIDNQESFPIKALSDSANIVRSFFENYHEKLEEDFIFPVFEKAGKQTGLVKTLREQHNAGRNLTDYILKHSKYDLLKR